MYGHVIRTLLDMPNAWDMLLAHYNCPGTDPGYENTEPNCTLTVLCNPSIICPLRSVDAKFNKFV